MIGLVIGNILNNNADVKAIVADRVYPILMEQTTALPAVIYTVENLAPSYDKSTWEFDETKFTVTSIAKTYKEAITLSFKVRKALELAQGIYAGVVFERIQVESTNESFDLPGDSYIQEITFTVRVNQYDSLSTDLIIYGSHIIPGTVANSTGLGDVVAQLNALLAVLRLQGFLV